MMRFFVMILVGMVVGSTSLPAQELVTDQDRLSYAYGWQLGEQIGQDSAEWDIDAIIAAIRDSVSEAELQVSQEEMTALLAAHEKILRAEQVEALRILSEENLVKSREFLVKNAGKNGIVGLPSGVQYRIIDEGDDEGARPTMQDTVGIQYRGSKMDGLEFVSTFRTPDPEFFELGSDQVLAGWKEVLPLMRVGSVFQLFLPPEMAYGPRPNRNFRISPNEALVFDIKLVEIVQSP